MLGAAVSRLRAWLMKRTRSRLTHFRVRRFHCHPAHANCKQVAHRYNPEALSIRKKERGWERRAERVRKKEKVNCRCNCIIFSFDPRQIWLSSLRIVVTRCAAALLWAGACSTVEGFLLSYVLSIHLPPPPVPLLPRPLLYYVTVPAKCFSILPNTANSDRKTNNVPVIERAFFFHSGKNFLFP